MTRALGPPAGGLRARLTLTFGGLTLVAVVVFAVVIAGTVERLLVNRLAQDLVAQAGLIAGQVAEDLANGDQRTRRAGAGPDRRRDDRARAGGRRAGAAGRRNRDRAARGPRPAQRRRRAGGGAGRPASERRPAALRTGERGAVRRAADRLGRQGGRRDPPGLHPAATSRRRFASSTSASPLARSRRWPWRRRSRPACASAVTTPIRALSHATRGLAAGELDQRLELQTRGEVGELVEAFNQTAGRLHEYEIARREFASDVSHELHALASAMETAAQALQRGADREPALRDRLVRWTGRPHPAARAAGRRPAGAGAAGGRAPGDRAATGRRWPAVARQAVAEWTAEASLARRHAGARGRARAPVVEGTTSGWCRRSATWWRMRSSTRRAAAR